MPTKSISVQSLLDGQSDNKIPEVFNLISSPETMLTHPADTIKKMWLGSDEEFEEFLIEGGLQRTNIDKRTKTTFLDSFSQYIKDFQEYMLKINRTTRKEPQDVSKWISMLEPALIGKKLQFKEPELFMNAKYDLSILNTEQFERVVEQFKENFSTGSFASFLQANLEEKSILLTLSKYHLVLNERTTKEDRVKLLTATGNSGKDKVEGFEHVASISPLPSINYISKIETAPVSILFASRDMLNAVQEELKETVLIKRANTPVKEKKFGESGNNIFSLGELQWDGEASKEEVKAFEEYFKGVSFNKGEIHTKKGSMPSNNSIKNLTGAPIIDEKQPRKPEEEKQTTTETKKEEEATIGKVDLVPAKEESSQKKEVEKENGFPKEKKFHGEISENEAYSTIITAVHQSINEITPKDLKEGVSLFFNAIDTTQNLDSAFKRLEEKYSANPILHTAIKYAIPQEFAKFTSYKKEVSRLQEENTRLTKDVDEKISSIGVLEKSESSLKEKLQTTENSLKTNKGEYEKKVAEIQAQFEKVTTAYKKKEETIKLLEQKIGLLESENQEQIETFKTAIDALKESNEIYKNQVETLKTELKKAQKESATYKKKEESTKSKLQKLLEKNMEKSEEVKKTMQAVKKKASDIKRKTQQGKLPENPQITTGSKNGKPKVSIGTSDATELFQGSSKTAPFLASATTQKVATIHMIQNFAPPRLSKEQKGLVKLIQEGYSKSIDTSLPLIKESLKSGEIIQENGFYTFKNLENSSIIKSNIYFALKEISEQKTAAQKENQKPSQ